MLFFNFLLIKKSWQKGITKYFFYWLEVDHSPMIHNNHILQLNLHIFTF